MLHNKNDGQIPNRSYIQGFMKFTLACTPVPGENQGGLFFFVQFKTVPAIKGSVAACLLDLRYPGLCLFH